MVKVSCIIPTYNEEKRIANVLNVVADHPLIDEVIVVDDGSKDKTIEVVSAFKNIKLIVHEKNAGKSAGIYDGCKAAQGEFLLFLDADLLGLTKENVGNLIEPVLSHAADVTISYRGNSPRLWKLVGFDYISGERVFRKSMLAPVLEKILTIPRFGLEVFLNQLIINNQERIKIVPWPEVHSPFKNAKYGLWKGIRGDIGMIKDIFTTFTIFTPIIQLVRLKRLIIK